MRTPSYPLLLTLWLIGYIGPMLPGEWYEPNFSIYQSAISLFLILCALPFREFWWIKSFCTVCLLQIALNFGNYIGDIPQDAYNTVLNIFNGIEFCLLFIVGLIAQRGQNAGDNADLNRRNSRSSEGSRR